MIADATARLASAGVESPRNDAELLAAHVLGVSRGRLLLADGFTAAQADAYRRLVDRRHDREPLQYLTGTAAFRHLELAVGPGAFVPRPETELLAGWGIDLARTLAAPVVVDLCAGPGPIALSVAQEVPTATVYAVEKSPAALEWLRRNAADLAPDARVVAGDVADPSLLAELRGRVDVLLSNPPYVPEGTPVPPEVDRFDPATAVFGGPDGLAVVRPVIERAAALLRPGGGLALEHDEEHAVVLPELLRNDGRFDRVEAHADLTGRPRFTTARRRSDSLSWQTGSS
ncbi:peptide chain release factor N(5)-glutamine methyltransferase [Asanoa sp. WMMD1127]|uniref:peptide chain release factor N(5)-glutamine methyltransferase n=1 Tax=Asanoa sp. WMMD1127 TaxID=3016107 RepID=UPI002416DEAD|nr:peptide chain release factor N(5)-glutamine methyltransferase [Asanoa sp. WMMD1127]MDG4823310.1 peptide chain release factor N(5)-glutamine methyltransferase [Asanoa sp. WMMD1127]